MTTALEDNPVSDTDEPLSDRIRVPLTLKDRCDGPGIRQGELSRCDAQAFVRVHLHRGDLYFCGHHFRIYEPIFAKAGYPVHDERDRINERPNFGLL